jgi:glycosyltransferase involved in cell wall biosynthesis
MRVAILQDWLTSYGGAEKCIEATCELWPQAEIFTLVYRPELFKDSIISSHRVNTSFVQRLPFSKRLFRHYFAIYPFAVEQYDLSGFDIVISFSAAFSHGVLTQPEQLHVAFIHTPMRYAWSGYQDYLRHTTLRSKWKNWLMRILMHRIRKWDFIAAQRPDVLVANSQTVRERIWKYYRRRAYVINPPVETEHLRSIDLCSKQNYFVTIGRLVPYKRIELIVEVFAGMPAHRLLVIGDGPEKSNLRRIAAGRPNIEFLGFVNESRKVELLSKARAFVFAAHEDFGIAAVEAQACGTPVVAFGKGGVSETIVDGRTGVFFTEQTVPALKKGIERFIEIEHTFDVNVLIENAKRFDKAIFKDKFKKLVEEKMVKLKLAGHTRSKSRYEVNTTEK